MKNKILKAGILSFFVLALLTSGFLAFKYFYSKEAATDREKKALPSVISYSSTPTLETQKTQIPREVNWDVPFTSQAPNANWDYTHEEACEEAALLMTHRFFDGQDIPSFQDSEDALQQIIAWENKNLGFFESTTAEKTARIARDMLNLETQIVTNPKVDDIKAALSNRKLILVPTAGREVGNPFYTPPGPLYHMIVLKGYTETQFITNDPGTKRGENYPYEFKVILDANHDWNNGDVADGAKKMIFVWK